VELVAFISGALAPDDSKKDEKYKHHTKSQKHLGRFGHK
jgi:hypothetical protein